MLERDLYRYLSIYNPFASKTLELEQDTCFVKRSGSFMCLEVGYKKIKHSRLFGSWEILTKFFSRLCFDLKFLIELTKMLSSSILGDLKLVLE